jgi:hypothetical protein
MSPQADHPRTEGGQERLKGKPWRAVEFVVRDPDGNLLLFGSPV